jgi:hypothetical protein
LSPSFSSNTPTQVAQLNLEGQRIDESGRATRTPRELVTVAPPGRSHNDTILQATSRKASITEALAERCLFDRGTKDSAGNLVIRPSEYDPPPGSVPPHPRPKKGS